MSRKTSLNVIREPATSEEAARRPEQRQPIEGRVCLVVMPTVRTHSPAFGASLLKSYLHERGIECDIQYFNLRFRDRLTEHRDRLGLASSAADLFELGSRYWVGAGEWLFAQHMQGPGSRAARDYPDILLSERFDQFSRQLRQDYLELTSVVEPFLQECLEAVDWESYQIIGLSSMFAQQHASLALSQRLADRYPNNRLIFGGANCDGVMGPTLLEQYPWLDNVFHGKADRSFPEFAKRVLRGEPYDDIPGLSYRDGDRVVVTGNPQNIGRLDETPVPDFDDYFEQQRDAVTAASEPPYFLTELSRGCYWAVKSHCIFCGLFGDKARYQVKAAKRAVSELSTQYDKHGVRRFRLVDTILNPRHFTDVMPALAEQPVRFRFTCEIKADISRSQAQALGRAGCFWAQPGIESFATSILGIIRKGTSALQNVACLRHMREAGVRAGWNFIFGFPGEEPGEYARMLPLLEAIGHLDPPTFIGPMHLVRFSPAFDQAEALGFTQLRPCEVSRTLYPFSEAVVSNLCSTFEFEYADGRDPLEYARPVVELLRDWQDAESRGLLVYHSLGEEGGLIHDTRPGLGVGRQGLDSVRARVYEACDDIVTLDAIEAHVAAASDSQAPSRAEIEDAIAWLCSRRLLVHDAGEYLGVALSDETLVPWATVSGLVREG